MRKTELKKILSLILCIVLIAVTALFAAGCSDKTNTDTEAPITSESGDVSVLGKGATAFDLTVVDAEGAESFFTVNTDETTVGDALLALELIAGDESEYGLYVKTVNSITAEYEVDGTYWAFYIDGEYATSGVDTTDIVPGSVYMLKVEK